MVYFSVVASSHNVVCWRVYWVFLWLWMDLISSNDILFFWKMLCEGVQGERSNHRLLLCSFLHGYFADLIGLLLLNYGKNHLFQPGLYFDKDCFTKNLCCNEELRFSEAVNSEVIDTGDFWVVEMSHTVVGWGFVEY